MSGGNGMLWTVSNACAFSKRAVIAWTVLFATDKLVSSSPIRSSARFSFFSSRSARSSAGVSSFVAESTTT